MSRVSNPMIQQIMLSDMHKNLSRLLEYQHQLASGKKNSRPSDNPIDVVRELAMQTSLTENSQYIRNQDDAMTWLSNTDTAFNQMTDILHRIRELTIYAGNGALGAGESEAIASEISLLQEELRNTANYSVEGRYLLSGLSTGVKPFLRDENGQVVYLGNTGKVSYEMERGVEGTVSFHGREVFPEDYASNTLTSVDLPLDFQWTGRDEILQITVGSRTVKVHLPEKWTDANLNGSDNATDYNRFRDSGELSGHTLDDIAGIIRSSLDMGEVGRLLSVSVDKDEAGGTQRLVFTSHTGEPIAVTGWPETDAVAQAQTIESLDLSAWTAGDGTIRLFFQGGEDVQFTLDASDTPSTIADKLTTVLGVAARLSPDGNHLLVTSQVPGKPFTLELSGSARSLFSTSTEDTVSVASQPAARPVDHSHIDFASFLGIETALKSRQFGPGEVLSLTDDLHLRFESGKNSAELKINGGISLTMDQLAERIRQVAGDWLEVVVREDSTEAGLGTTGSLEEMTSRLLLRPVDNAPLVVFDKNTAGYALDLGLSTAIRSRDDTAASTLFPSIPCVDPNMAAILSVTLGGENFRVKIYPEDVLSNTPPKVDQLKVMEQIVKQVNAASGSEVLGYSVLDAAAGRGALYAKNGESLRIADLPLSDPSFSPSYSAGIALQMGLASGLTSSPIPDNLLSGAGTIRIESPGRTLDVAITAGDTPRIIADKIRQAGEGWLDVTYFDPELPAAGSGARIGLASRDGSPLSIYDVEGDAASTVLSLDNAVRGDADVSGWTSAAGDTLSLTVDGYTHTLDLNTIFDSNSSGTIDAEDVASAINSRFQGQDIKATLVNDGGGQYLVLTSPRGYSIEAGGSAQAALLGTAAATPSRAGSPSARYTQNVVVRTASNSQKTDFFGVLDNLVNSIKAEDREGLSNIMLGKVDAFMDNLLKCRTSQGALMKRYENNQARFKQNDIYLTELYSKISDIDLAETSTKFAMAQAVYQSSLAVIAKIVQPTLVDFLR